MLNKVLLMGRTTKDVEVRYSAGDNSTAIGRFNLAVERRYKREGQPDADFISCVAFGKTAEFLEKYGKKGTKFVVEGRIQTGSYQNKDGNTVYTTDVVVENIMFAESKNAGTNNQSQQNNGNAPAETADDGFMNIPDGLEDELPFA